MKPTDNKEWDTPERLRAVAFLASETYAKQQMRADWQQTDKRLELLAAKVVLRAHKLGIPLYVHAAFRTRDEQEQLLRRGVTKVAYPGSAHNIGEAFDLVHGVYHWELTNREWSYISWLVNDELRKLNANLPVKPTDDKPLPKLELNWGGNDGSKSDTFRWDPAHWEILGYRARRRYLTVLPPIRRSPSATVALLKL